MKLRRTLSSRRLWDRSGPTCDGYSSPDEMAGQMLEERLDPHMKELEKFRKLRMDNQSMCYLMGMLKGI